ncbi:MAG: hypothetical protein CL868_15235 [Cytophagaceae bacterium]|nr:hypothetical protein [Cytophagaceae bacterium]|tara:strand:+ start:8493 stop:9074 length:582 start_codon:yes stop_codon:yes gene_type:complete
MTFFQDNTDTIKIPVLFIEVFALMLVAFLIGYFFAYFYQKAKFTKKLEMQAIANAASAKRVSKKSSTPSRTMVPEEDHEEYDDDLVAAELNKRAFGRQVQNQPVHKEGLYLDFERIGYAEATDSDNLQKIMGIGPYTEEKLNEIGIYTFSQIARLNEKDIEVVTELIKFFPDRIKNDRWVSKAKILEKQKKAV